uniref:Lipocalin/cytosolic fatty-acid binding domain-containing protein n=1 Tax=Graphocephala atropunctata TaxID=36148 RepID=A0A1B6MIQ8_9HEMI
MKSQLLLVLVLAAQAWATCPKVSVIEYLDHEKFSEVWYQHSYNGTLKFKGWNRCVKFTFSTGKNNKIISIKITRIIEKVEKPVETNWEATLSKEHDGRLTVTMKILFVSIKFNLNIIATDYKSYALVQFCKKFIFKYNVYMLLLREPNISEATQEKIYEDIFLQSGYNVSQYTLTNYKDCENPANYLQYIPQILALING